MIEAGFFYHSNIFMPMKDEVTVEELLSLLCISQLFKEDKI